MSTLTTVLIASALVVAVLVASSVRIVREYQRIVVFRLGRLRGERGPGLVLIVPFVERTRWVNLQVDTADIPPQDLITKDNVTIRVEAAVFFRVVDPGEGRRGHPRLPARRAAHRPDHAPRHARTA